MSIDYFNFNSKIKLKIGCLIVAQPFFIDSYFNRYVILICEHNKNGSLGFQVNKPLKNNLNDFLKNIKTKKEVYLGGPVNNNNLYFIHYYNNLEKESVKLNNDIYFGNNLKQLSKLISLNKINLDTYKFFLGYSGWSSGQLEKEINDNSWIVIPNFNSSIIFSSNYENIWKNVLKESGSTNKMFSNYPIDPRLN